MIKASISGRDLTIVLITVFVPKQENPKQILTQMKVETDGKTIIVVLLFVYIYVYIYIYYI